MIRDQASARRLYRVLLHAYPREHREHFGAEMEEAFLALWRMDGARAGVLGVVRCWAGASVDALMVGATLRWREAVGGDERPYTDPRRKGGGGEMMSTVVADIQFALRSLRRRPAFAMTAIMTIAIGIGANAAVFTVVNGFMFTPLPYDDADELIAIWAAHPALGWSHTDVSHADAWDWRRRATTLEDLTVFDGAGFNLTGGDAPELVSALRVTPNFLSVFGLAPRLGRDFQATEMGRGQDRVAILTDGFWERRFARDPDILGTTLILDGEAVVVIGVMPPDFLFHSEMPDLIRPWHVAMTSVARDSHSANAVARLTEGASIEAARAELSSIADELAALYQENRGWTVEVQPLLPDVRGEVATQASIVLMVAVAFILLMACVNVANLLMARAGGRTREIAVRSALGAGRARVMRQLLTESAVLGAAGAILGMGLALTGSQAIVAALPSDVPPVFQFEMNRDVLGFTVAITVGAVLLFGLTPALRATDRRGDVLRDGSRAGVDRGAGRFGSALVVGQTAMAVVLLVGGGLLMKSVAGMRGQDFGFEPESVLTARVALPSSEYETPEAARVYWEDVMRRIREIPGVVEAGTTQSHPLMGSNWSRNVQIAGQDVAADQARRVRLTLASPGLFEALRFRMDRGRVFTASDGPGAPHVAIVNEAFVERFLGPDDDPLARTILAEGGWSAAIVGVVHDVVERRVDSPPEPSMYLPIAQSDARTRSIVVRTEDEPTSVVGAVQEQVWAVDGDIPVYAIQTMPELVDDRVGGFAVIGYLMGVFAILSLVLGAVGIYGVTAHAAGRRTSEIGLRLAMGADRSDVIGLVVRQGALRAGMGLAIGLGLALLVSGSMSSILIGVSPRDPATFVTVVAVLGTVSFLGLFVPARRASRIDPVRALTAE